MVLEVGARIGGKVVEVVDRFVVVVVEVSRHMHTNAPDTLDLRLLVMQGESDTLNEKLNPANEN